MRSEGLLQLLQNDKEVGYTYGKLKTNGGILVSQFYCNLLVVR